MSSHPPPHTPRQEDRPTVPAPPVHSTELARQWEQRLKETKKENGSE